MKNIFTTHKILIILCIFISVGLCNTYVTHASNQLSTQEIEAYIRYVFREEGPITAEVAVAVFWAESDLDCNVVSKTNDVGVAQINEVHWQEFGGKEKLKDCKYNIEVSKILYDRHGFKPWNAYKESTYIAYLSDRYYDYLENQERNKKTTKLHLNTTQN